MASNKKTVQSKLECKQALSTELDKSAERLKELGKVQNAGDFSIELARKINVLRYHIEVLKNRINGKFEAKYSPTQTLPEGRGLRTGNYNINT